MHTHAALNLSGQWTGRITGTNNGGATLDLTHSGNELSGTATLNEPEFGVYRYQLKGKSSLLLEDGTMNVFAKLDSPQSSNAAVSFGDITIQAKVSDQRTMRGKWVSTLGTKGAFSLERSEGAEQHTGECVFIVHGHDEAVMSKVAHVLTRLKLRGIILNQQPDGGRTIIEKFEKHAGQSGFAIILLTADDLGGSKQPGAALSPRARQNVILEMGYFIAKLGRSRVCVLREPGIELPSDLFGVVYSELDRHGAWETKLGRELKAAGYPVDMNLL